MKQTLYNTVRFTGFLTSVRACTDMTVQITQTSWQNRGDGFYQGTLFQDDKSWIDVRIPDYYFEEHKDELTGSPFLKFHAFGTLQAEVGRGTGVVHWYLKVTDIQAAENCDVD